MTIKRTLSFVLCFIMLFVTFCPKAVAEAVSLDHTYLKEIVTSTGDTDAAAKKWLTDRGYTVVPGDLNAGTGENPVYLGYKTTMNRSEAITDVSFMDMNGGYEWMDYEQFAIQNQNNIAEMTEKLAGACGEMRQKLNAGSRAARIALSYLNIFTVPEAHQKLGDYLLDPSRTRNEYRMILLVCNSLVINAIYSHLALGISDDPGDTWVDRLSEDGPDESLRGEDHTDYWGSEYDRYAEDAEDILAVLQNYAKEYRAAARNGGDVSLASMSAAEAEAALGAFTEGGEADDRESADALVLAVHEYLNQFDYSSQLPADNTGYNNISVKPEYADEVMFDGENAYFVSMAPGYGNEPEYEPMGFEYFIQNYADYVITSGYRRFPESTKLGDVFLELAEIDEDNEEELSLLYPVVKALTPGQRYLLTVQGLETFASLAAADGETYSEIEGKRDEYADMLFEALNSREASVWVGTNRDIFDSKIGLTTRAKRAADASNDYDELTRVTEFDREIKTALCYIGAVSCAAAGVTMISIGVGAFIFHGIGAAVYAGFQIMTHAIAATVCGVAFGCVGFVGLFVTGLVVAALIVCAIVYAVDYFKDLYNYYNPDYTEIPAVMIDGDNNRYIIYKAVRGMDGEPADLNIWEGRKWNALYVSYDERAGSPLVEIDAGNAFTVVYGSTATPDCTAPVAGFGTVKAVNLNSNAYDDDVNGIYLYFYPENLAPATGSRTSGQTEEQPAVSEETVPAAVPSDGSALYLESLVLYTHEDPRVVKDRITIESGCNLIDFNLTPDTDYATYIGYTTTKNPANAITDIRVSYAGVPDKYYYGTATDTYGMAGTTSRTVGEEESTELLASLYYTKSKNRGTPILADLLISGSRPDKSAGYEPVNLFSGGDAFDFNTYPEEDNDTWKKHTYIYFKPSVVYNESNSKAYLGGISFVSGSTDMNEGKLEDYVKELGLTASEIDISKGFFNAEDRTWLCYSVTYNPYRAIYDIGVYTAEYKSSYLKENIVLDGAGYVACQTYTQGDLGYYGNFFWGGDHRLIRPDHAYISKTEDYGGDDEYGDSLVCCRGMYVSGPVTGKTPITMDGFIISKTPEIPSGYIAVHDMTEKYASAALNLAMYDKDHKNQMYIFYKGTAPVKAKYISSISVFFSNEEDYSYDMVMYQLMAAGGDEIIRVNLAAGTDDSWTYTDGAACFDEDSDRDDYEDAHAYIRVTRTNTKNSGIGSICMVEGSKGGAKTLTLPSSRQGTTALYTCAGDKITYNEKKSYYLYYATVGNKINEIKVDKVAVQHDWITVLNENLEFCSTAGWCIHTYSDVSLPYYSTVMFHRSDDKIKSISALLAAGCTDVDRINQNGDPVYIGWAKTSSTTKSIKNIILADTDSLFSGNSAYQCGGSAHGVYIFYTTEGDKTKSIVHMKVATSVPTEFGNDLKWEYTQKDNGTIANLNTVVDNRKADEEYRLYVNHNNNQPYSSGSFMAASTLAGNTGIGTIVLLCMIPVVLAGALIAVRRIKKAPGKKEE